MENCMIHLLFSCSICLDSLSNGKPVRKALFCNHSFHSKCLLDWLELKAFCPNCKKEFSKQTIEEYQKKDSVAKPLDMKESKDEKSSSQNKNNQDQRARRSLIPAAGRLSITGPVRNGSRAATRNQIRIDHPDTQRDSIIVEEEPAPRESIIPNGQIRKNRNFAGAASLRPTVSIAEASNTMLVDKDSNLPKESDRDKPDLKPELKAKTYHRLSCNNPAPLEASLKKHIENNQKKNSPNSKPLFREGSISCPVEEPSKGSNNQGRQSTGVRHSTIKKKKASTRIGEPHQRNPLQLAKIQTIENDNKMGEDSIKNSSATLKSPEDAPEFKSIFVNSQKTETLAQSQLMNSQTKLISDVPFEGKPSKVLLKSIPNSPQKPKTQSSQTNHFSSEQTAKKGKPKKSLPKLPITPGNNIVVADSLTASKTQFTAPSSQAQQGQNFNFGLENALERPQYSALKSKQDLPKTEQKKLSQSPTNKDYQEVNID